MSSTAKTLLTVWISAVVTFAGTATYILPQDDRINAPGELGEVFTSTGFLLLIALLLVTIIITFSIQPRRK